MPTWLSQPAAMTIQSGVLPLGAQIALAVTVLFTSFSSTVLLQVVAHPYVCTLHEIQPNVATAGGTNSNSMIERSTIEEPSVLGNTTPSTQISTPAITGTTTAIAVGDRQFRAMRYNMFGMHVSTVFSLKQANKSVSDPFEQQSANGGLCMLLKDLINVI